MTQFPRIICTLGTKTDELSIVKSMVRNGMGAARINTAYGSFDDYERRINLVRKIRKDMPIIIDLSGPKLRLKVSIKKMVEGKEVRVPCKYDVKTGDYIVFGFDDNFDVSFDSDLRGDLGVGDSIYLENGTIRGVIADAKKENLYVKEGAMVIKIEKACTNFLQPGMGANIPGKYLHIPKLTNKDMNAISFAIKHKVSNICLSFVRDENDLINLYGKIKKYKNIGIVAKIEDSLGIGNLEKILGWAKNIDVGFSVMIGRGDLFTEYEYFKLFEMQRKIIKLCKRFDVPVILATGILASMQSNRFPARAEICDVATALSDDVDGFLLSDETANGNNPALVVKTLQEIIDYYKKIKYF